MSFLSEALYFLFNTSKNMSWVVFQFIPWKKKYFRLKKQDSKCEDEMTEILDQKGLLEVELLPVNLARYGN